MIGQEVVGRETVSDRNLVEEEGPIGDPEDPGGKENKLDSKEIAELESFLQGIETESSVSSFSGFGSEDLRRYRDIRQQGSLGKEIGNIGNPEVSKFDESERNRMGDIQEQDEVNGSERIRMSELQEPSVHAENERVRLYRGPATRSRGPVPEYEWVMRKGV